MKLTIGKFTITIDKEGLEKIQSFSKNPMRVVEREGCKPNVIIQEGGVYQVSRVLTGTKSPNRSVKFRDGDSLNLTRANLKVVDRKSQARGKVKHKALTSTYMGVHFVKDRNKWRAVIKPSVGKAKVHIGYFDDEMEAAKAYDTAAKKAFGPMATLNFPEVQRKKSSIK